MLCPSVMSHSANAKWRWLRTPMHVPAMGQWWSMRDTHRSQKGQCLLRKQRAVWQVRQYLPPSLKALRDAVSATARDATSSSFKPFVASLATARLTRRMFPAHASRVLGSLAVGKNPGPSRYTRQNAISVVTNATQPTTQTKGCVAHFSFATYTNRYWMPQNSIRACTVAAPNKLNMPLRVVVGACSAYLASPLKKNSVKKKHGYHAYHTTCIVAKTAATKSAAKGTTTSACGPYAYRYMRAVSLSAASSCICNDTNCSLSHWSGSSGSGSHPGVHRAPCLCFSISSRTSLISASSALSRARSAPSAAIFS
mmetsp:Transcript_14450/g.60874  ORF Transcript_14450/g.60874 Transcript_14450/m.60874 type:complete len:311 (-) Transcript_14450:661-1593(-)